MASLAALSDIVLVFTIVLYLLGIRPFILDSDSMLPLYRKGRVILVNTRVRFNEALPGDVVVYRSDSGTLVMHRLVGHNTLKGDASSSCEYVPLSDINFVGRVID